MPKRRYITPPSRPPYTGPSQVVTTSVDENKHRLTLSLFMETERMRLRSDTNYKFHMGYMRKADHPELYALACLPRDTGRERHTMAPEGVALSLPTLRPYYDIPITLGDIAAVDPNLADNIRSELLQLLWG